ncbi:hypothetical protein FRC18_007370 [Serendipita sp. 400]|nr:hypothetical protein FRC18_007370 [Serendipita sp. 400]
MSLPSSISAISDLCFRAISGSSSASLSIDKIASIRFEVLSLQQDVAFVQALKDIPSQSVLNALNSLSTNLTKLFETSNATIAQPTFTQQTLPTALELLRRCRRDVGSVGKEWITSSEPSTQVNVILKVTENTDPHTENILEAFMRMPFGLCPADVASVQWSRDLWPRWAGVMERTGEQWAEKMLEIGGSSQLQSSQYRLLGKLWGNLTHATLPLTYGWAPGDTQLGRFEAFLDQLDQGLRDSLFRQMSAHSMVFVSSENSGKSTLINAILGKKLLPTGSGLVTAIPCRIIHSIGLEKPKLTIDGDYWSNRLTDLRASLVLPRDEIEKQLKLHYVRNEVRDFLSSIVDGSVTLDPTVMGDEAILLTLKRLNYLAQLLNIFTFRYDSFISHSWVSIHTSFPGLSENIGWTEYEIVDIPGVPNDESKFHWDELTIKSLQRATSIVAVVPTTGIASGYWTRLPNYIRKGTHLPVSAVVITQTDVVPDPKSSEEEQEEWKRIRAEIQRRFWPDAKEDKFASGQILECSVLVGQQLEVLASILSDHKEKSPTFEEFWSPRAPMVPFSFFLAHITKLTSVSNRPYSITMETRKIGKRDSKRDEPLSIVSRNVSKEESKKRT